jgi:chorismate-pyruvate lyase
MAEKSPAPILRELFEIFADEHPVEISKVNVIPGEAVPQPYRDLLVHQHHMTVTVERFHGQPVQLRILAHRRTGDYYSRMILLALEGTGEVVQFGIMRTDLSCCSEEVREAILSGRIPLGRVLIEHNVLRRIDPLAYLKIVPTRALMEWFGMTRAIPVYGRIAGILCNGLDAIDLLEIVRPEPQLQP